jgi:hypothetical protein
LWRIVFTISRCAAAASSTDDDANAKDGIEGLGTEP